MKVTANSNAHGANWSATGGGNLIRVCYQDFFTNPYSPSAGEDPHACKSGNSNIVLKLANVNNSHAANPSTTSGGYNTNVCFGDLTCQLRSATTGCLSGEKNILNLSSENNAHISIYGAYPYLLCCKKANTLGTCGNGVIESGEQCEDTPPNTINGDGCSSTCQTETPITCGNGNIDAGEQCDGTNLGEETCQNLGFTGGTLSCASNCARNTAQCIGGAVTGPPTAKIDLKEGIYFVGETINFTHSSFNVSRPITVEWRIDDPAFDDFANRRAQNNFTHNYIQAGQKVITLKVTDTRGEFDTDRISILLLASPGIYAKIPQPAHESVIRGVHVDFNGSDSYIVNYTGTQGSSYLVYCLGGNCPDTTIGCPPALPPWVCPLQVIGNNKKGDFSEMDFRWTFGDDNDEIKDGLGRVKDFINYKSYGNKIIELIYSSQSLSANIHNDFKLIKKTGCDPETQGRIWYDTSGVAFDTLQDGVCGGDDGLANGIGDCCPQGGIDIGSRCVVPDEDTDPDNEHSGIFCSTSACISNYDLEQDDGSTVTKPIRLCNDYNYLDEDDRQEQCEADCAGAWDKDEQKAQITSYKQEGYTIEVEECVWRDNKCGVAYGKLDDNNDNPNPTETCVDVILSDQCVDGDTRVIKYTLNKTNAQGQIISGNCVSDECPSGGICERDSLCGTGVLVLPFFGWINFVIAGVGIAIIYGFYIFFRRR